MPEVVVLHAKLLRSIGLAQIVVLEEGDANSPGRVILLTGRYRAEGANPGDQITLERTDVDGTFTYRAIQKDGGI